MEFSVLLLTAPTEKIAAVYLEQLQALRSTLPALKSCKIYCVADPSGVRIGSGGGTLNALDFLRQQGVDVSTEKILLIHSGGDSRRAPFYSLCGKAWITLNATVGGADTSPAQSTLLANPLSVLIEELSRFATNLGPESLMVASSDVLLDLTGHYGECPSEFARDAVTVVSVPEDPRIATNHGVLVRGNDTGDRYNTTDADADQYTSQLAGDYLQKPSVEEMYRKNACYSSITGATATVAAAGTQDFAMIDTGVVIFTGRALQTFVGLAADPIVSMCTKRRLQQLQQLQDKVGPSQSAISALRFEL